MLACVCVHIIAQHRMRPTAKNPKIEMQRNLCSLQKTDLSELETTSAPFSELLKFLQTSLGYCDILKEIKPKREHIRCLETELEKSINVLQALTIERNKLEIDLVELKQKHVEQTAERCHAEKNLLETEKRLVSQ